MLQHYLMLFLLCRGSLASVRLATAATPKHSLYRLPVLSPSSTRVLPAIFETSQTCQLTMDISHNGSSAIDSSVKNDNNTWWFPKHDVSLSSIVESMKNPEIRGSDPWGFVTYLCTYGNDEAWERMVKLIKDSLQGQAKQKTIVNHGGKDWDDLEVQHLLWRHELTLIEDRDKLDGATSHEVRDHFIHWVKDELIQKRLSSASDEVHRALANSRPGRMGPDRVLGPRYNFCLFVDDICLEYLDKMASPVVKILWKQ
jgi:hypothetical protein